MTEQDETPIKLDTELEAIRQISALLEGLEPATRKRVIRYVLECINEQAQAEHHQEKIRIKEQRQEQREATRQQRVMARQQRAVAEE